jgi:hypothetical protein
VDILWNRCAVLIWYAACGLAVLQELQASFDMHVRRVKISSTLVCVERIGCLVIARLVLEHVSGCFAEARAEKQTYQCTKVVPDLRYIWVQTDCSGVCIKRIAILVDLIIENSD